MRSMFNTETNWCGLSRILALSYHLTEKVKTSARWERVRQKERMTEERERGKRWRENERERIQMGPFEQVLNERLIKTTLPSNDKGE